MYIAVAISREKVWLRGNKDDHYLVVLRGMPNEQNKNKYE